MTGEQWIARYLKGSGCGLTLSSHSPGGSEENHKIPCSNYLVPWMVFECNSFKITDCNITATAIYVRTGKQTLVEFFGT
jgi:hypothetical protein